MDKASISELALRTQEKLRLGGADQMTNVYTFLLQQKVSHLDYFFFNFFIDVCNRPKAVLILTSPQICIIFVDAYLFTGTSV